MEDEETEAIKVAKRIWRMRKQWSILAQTGSFQRLQTEDDHI
jgi:hypothetical protein